MFGLFSQEPNWKITISTTVVTSMDTAIACKLALHDDLVATKVHISQQSTQ